MNGRRSRSPRARRARRRGLTLIEILVVLALIAIITGVAVSGSQFPSARLKRSATMITSAIKVAYTRATATSRCLRLVMDLDQPRIWLEESDIPMLVQSRDASGAGGARAVTDAEKVALAEGEKILKGPAVPKPQFTPVDAAGFGAGADKAKGGRALQRGIGFRSVQAGHDDSAHTSGRAYLYFWPGGMTERASIQLRYGESADDTNTLTLLVSPLTGKVTIKQGAVDLVVPTDDEAASDRQDTGL
jgi:general secretion pathway protein H